MKIRMILLVLLITLTVYFGDNDSAFTLSLYDNDTAAIARHVGAARRQLPIYHFDDYDHTPEFISAVENNPVPEGWENKIVIIEPGD